MSPPAVTLGFLCTPRMLSVSAECLASNLFLLPQTDKHGYHGLSVLHSQNVIRLDYCLILSYMFHVWE